MSAPQTLNIHPDELRPGDCLPGWGDRIVASIRRGEFGHVYVWSEGFAPLALPAMQRVLAYREREAA